MARLVASWILALLLVLLLIFSVSAQASNQVTALNQAGEPITTLTDGDLVRLEFEMAEAADQPTTIGFYLDGNTNYIADCRIPQGERRCTTTAAGTLGWYWEQNQEVRPERIIHAVDTAVRWRALASVLIVVRPRPVVLVHGFGSSYTTWSNYLGPSGYLALMGLHGYAVGDGQVTGTMYTGNLINPRARTNTIAGNAAVLGEYIANVKAETGAEQVDLVVHSMGGLISRYYIDRLMGERDVAQLIMLGTPNAGSNCAVLPGSLGLYQPAGLELRESYIQNVFNPQIRAARGVPFYLFAGTPIQRRLLSPCSDTPNDMVVSLRSATAIPAQVVEVPIMHIDLTTSEELFTQYVAPLLRKPGIVFTRQREQPSQRLETDLNTVQFSHIYSGIVTSDEGNNHTIFIDNNVAVASFGLYDPSRTLTVTVRGASGNVIVLEPETHGLTIIDDPEALLYLGYGFENPRPGPWQVTVRPTDRTPPLGAEYAIIAHYAGGAVIEAGLSNHLPGIEEQVVLTATLQVGEEPLPVAAAEVTLIHPDGHSQNIAVSQSGAGITASWQPPRAGIYGVNVLMRSNLPDGAVAERSTYLAFEAFRDPPEIRQ